MQTIHVDYPFPPKLEAIARAAYPAWKGRKLRVRVAEGPINTKSYWDGGSRDYFVLLAASSETFQVPAQHPAFDAPLAGSDAVVLPANMVCVERSIFQGKEMPLTIHVPACAVSGYLPAPVDLSTDARIVLEYTASRKSSYGGRNRCQMAQDDGVRITTEAWDEAKTACIAQGFLTKAGAITAAGRNALGSRY